MTPRQIVKTLQAAGIDTLTLTISRDTVEVCVGYYETDNNGHKYGDCDRDATEALAAKVRTALGWTSGYTTGYGAWVVTAYTVTTDTGNCL